MSFLSDIVKIPKAVFNFLASPKGAKVVVTAGAVAEALGAPAIVVNVAESWITKIITLEQLAYGAAAEGVGVQKGTAVIAAMLPELSKDFPDLPAANIQDANDALVAFLKALTMPAVHADSPKA